MADKFNLIFGDVKLEDRVVWERYETSDAQERKHYVIKFPNGIEISYLGGIKDAYIDFKEIKSLNAPSYCDITIVGVIGLEIKGIDVRCFMRIDNATILSIDMTGSLSDELKHRISLTNSKSAWGARILTAESPENVQIIAQKSDEIRLGFGTDTRIKIKRV